MHPRSQAHSSSPPSSSSSWTQTTRSGFENPFQNTPGPFIYALPNLRLPPLPADADAAAMRSAPIAGTRFQQRPSGIEPKDNKKGEEPPPIIDDDDDDQHHYHHYHHGHSTPAPPKTPSRPASPSSSSSSFESSSTEEGQGRSEEEEEGKKKKRSTRHQRRRPKAPPALASEHGGWAMVSRGPRAMGIHGNPLPQQLEWTTTCPHRPFEGRRSQYPPSDPRFQGYGAPGGPHGGT
jgi:hypothetical protein